MPTAFTKEVKPTTTFTREAKPGDGTLVPETWDNSVPDTWDSSNPDTWDNATVLIVATVYTKETKPTTSYTKETKP